MSVSAVSSSNTYPVQNYQSQFQKVKSDFQQLGKDLQAGNLSQAQADFATLQKDAPNGPPQGSSAAKDLNSLGQALQSGNLSQAQQAYASVQQDVQQTGGHHHHHHHDQDGGGSSQSASSAPSNPLTQDFASLGSALQAGNVTAAQQAYAKVQNDLQKNTAPGLSGTDGNNTLQVVQPQQGALSAIA
jgi:soluble cytochrome b562